MEGFAAFISTTQAVAYTLAVAKGLAELRTVLKHGRCFLHDERTSVGHLQEIITGLVREEETDVDPGLYRLLQSIEITVRSLLNLFRQEKRRHLIYTLVVRRTEIYDSFASLERKKNTLILHLTAQNSAAISSLKASTLAHFTQACQMSKQTHSSSSNSAYASPESSKYQPDKRSHREGEGTLVAQPASMALSGHHPGPHTDHDGGATPNLQHSPNQLKQAESKQTGAGQPLSQQQQMDLSSKAMPTFNTARNAAKNKSEQTIYRPQGENVQRSPNQLKQAESKQAGTGQPLSQQQQMDLSSQAMPTFHTARNSAINKSEQTIYRPHGGNARHVGNSSEDHSKQTIGAVAPAPETTRDSHCS